MPTHHFPGGLGGLYHAAEFGEPEPESSETVYPFEAVPEQPESSEKQTGTKQNNTKQNSTTESGPRGSFAPPEDTSDYQLCEVPMLEILSITSQNNQTLCEYRSVFDSRAVLQTPRLERISTSFDYETVSPIIPVNLFQFVHGLCSPFPLGHKFTEEGWLQYVANGLMPRLNRFIASWIGEETAPAANPFRVVFFGKNGILTGSAGMSYGDVQRRIQELAPMLENSVHFIQMRHKGVVLLFECVSPRDITEEYYRQTDGIPVRSNTARGDIAGGSTVNNGIMNGNTINGNTINGNTINDNALNPLAAIR
jgi:hypothetical protein